MIKKILLYCCFFLLLCWGSGMVCFMWKINHFGPVSEEKTDAIIALTGGRNRISEAVKLLKKGVAQKLFISGVGKDISLTHIGSIQHLNIAEDGRIEIGDEASNTVGNAIEAHGWIQKNGIKSIRLVTSNYHIVRSLVEFREYNPDLHIVLHPVYSEHIEKKWWTSWKTFSLLFKEYNKLIYVCCKNFLNFGEIKNVILTVYSL